MIRGAIPIVSAAITEYIAAAVGKKGRPATALAPLKALDPDLTALVILSTTFNRLDKNPGILSISMVLGGIIRVEVEAAAIQAEDHTGAVLAFALLNRMPTSRHEVIGWSKPGPTYLANEPVTTVNTSSI